MAQPHLPIDSYNFKALGVDYAYAQACRERSKPDECTLADECWVAHGTAAHLTADKAPRCRACMGWLKTRFGAANVRGR